MSTDTFDSRVLRQTDCYGQRFMRGGTYRYGLIPGSASPGVDDFSYSIHVSDGKDPEARMQQHTIRVKREGRSFIPDQGALEVATGDLVLWNCPTAHAGPFSVVGEKEFFGNEYLVNECGFSHAFGFPGEYAWADAHGSGLHGVVRVIEPQVSGKEGYQRWRQQLSKGGLVMISGNQAEPPEVDIVTGQTVYFAVVKSDGITVTDARLIGPDKTRGDTA